MSGSVRARRPASPPLGLSHTPPTSQRFPHPREEHLDADARKASASKGFTPRKGYPPGGLKLSSGEWKLLAVLIFIACAVRLFRLAKPNSVVCVLSCRPFACLLLCAHQNTTVAASMKYILESSLQNTSRPNISSTFTHRSPNYSSRSLPLFSDMTGILISRT